MGLLQPISFRSYRMHLPDGFLSDPVCLATSLFSAASLGGCIVALRSTRPLVQTQTVAAVAAGIFAAQMVNLPIAEATSGHMIGAALAAILCGPWAAVLCMSIVVVLQCMLFGDGGVMALGANLWNMAVIAPLVASVVYRAISARSSSRFGKHVAAFGAAIASVLAAALVCTVELVASGTQQVSVVLLPMLGVHVLIGLAEGLITVGVLAAVAVAARSWPPAAKHRAAGLVFAVVVAVLFAPLASSAPDGLERVADDFSFSSLATTNWAGVAPDYAMPGVRWEFLAVALGGLLGVVAVYVSATLASRTATCKVPKHPRGG
jgi:cobalt/nickel transport system permease protein